MDRFHFSKGGFVFSFQHCRCASAGILFIFSVIVSAQETGSQGLITGRIVDSSGAPVNGAKVLVHQSNRKTEYSTTTSNSGEYSAAGLSAGNYQVIVDKPGFTEVKKEVTLSPGQTVDLPISLEVASVLQTVVVNGQAPSVMSSPAGQTQSTVTSDSFKDTPAENVADILSLAPGVTTLAGNGPRDVSISIRGSNERQTYGVRNAQVFEDGFPVTQPDGLARTDLTDPHTYSGVDVVQGPSSTRYGNYATGGAINFHTRSGEDIHGIEVGSDFGSFGYFNDYLTFGEHGDKYDFAGFVSNVRSNNFTTNNAFNTITANARATFKITSRDRLTFKFIDNLLDTQLSIRLSLNQYRANPYQQGCATQLAAGCASVNIFNNGLYGATQTQTASEAGLGRHDRRTIAGARWEHDFSAATTWRTQVVYDDRDISQPTSSSTYRGPYPSVNLTSDVTNQGTLFGLQATSFAGVFFNDEIFHSYVYNLAPGGNASLGGQTQTVFGHQLNTGLRGQEELALNSQWSAVFGIAGEYTGLRAQETNISYSASGAANTFISGDRHYFNVAPEAGLVYQASQRWRFHSRLGTGYGTPQATNLFVTPNGTFGNNTQLKPQTNLGVDLGAEWTVGSRLRISATGFYEWFHNELVTQSAGVNLQSYTFNAPSSEHRGLEIGADWRPFAQALPGAQFRLSYLYDNQIYSKYTELLTAGHFATNFIRDGNNIPGVFPSYVNARFTYDQPTGKWRGFGGFIESNVRDSFYIDNANLIKSPGYSLVNVELHYDAPESRGLLSRLHFYFEIQNLANDRWVASAGNVSDGLNSTTGVEKDAAVLANSTGSIYAGTPRASFGGFRLRF
jgi:iron complex outermembrane receptor protein